MNQTYTKTGQYYKPIHFLNVGESAFTIVHKVLAFITIAWLNNGLFTYIMPYYPNTLRWGTFVLWFVLAIFMKPKFTKTFFSQCWLFLAFLAYTLLLSLFSNLQYLGLYLKNLTYLMMVYSIFLYYFDNRYRVFRKWIVKFLILDYSFLAINSYIHLLANPELARFLSAAPDTQAMLGIGSYQGVGNYAYFYGLVPINLLFGFLFLNTQKMRLLYLIPIILMFIVTLKASFTIAILFTLTFLFVIAVTKYINKYLLILVTPLIFFILMLSQKPIGLMLNNLAYSNQLSNDVSVRLSEISSLLLNESMNGSDLLERLNRYSMSITSFVHNFFFGISIPYNIGFSEGGHSSWLDLLALFGLFSLAFFTFLFKSYKYCLKNSPVIFKPFIRIYWFYFCCLGIINTLLFSNIFTVWFIFLPFFIKSFFESKQQTRETA